MRKKKSSTDKHSDSPSKKDKDENTDKKNPNPDDAYEETEPPVKKMSIAGGPRHPHHEEILDDIPN